MHPRTCRVICCGTLAHTRTCIAWPMAAISLSCAVMSWSVMWLRMHRWNSAVRRSRSVCSTVGPPPPPPPPMSIVCSIAAAARGLAVAQVARHHHGPLGRRLHARPLAAAPPQHRARRAGQALVRLRRVHKVHRDELLLLCVCPHRMVRRKPNSTSEPRSSAPGSAELIERCSDGVEKLK